MSEAEAAIYKQLHELSFLDGWQWGLCFGLLCGVALTFIGLLWYGSRKET